MSWLLIFSRDFSFPNCYSKHLGHNEKSLTDRTSEASIWCFFCTVAGQYPAPWTCIFCPFCLVWIVNSEDGEGKTCSKGFRSTEPQPSSIWSPAEPLSQSGVPCTCILSLIHLPIKKKHTSNKALTDIIIAVIIIIVLRPSIDIATFVSQ